MLSDCSALCMPAMLLYLSKRTSKSFAKLRTLVIRDPRYACCMPRCNSRDLLMCTRPDA